MLRLERLTKRFGEVLAVDDLSLEVDAGEFVTLLGPSGCGKTTTLRMIAGFETPSGGRIVLDGDDVTARPPQRRGIGMVFQNYALFPHLDVFENVAFGLKTQGVAKDAIAERVARALELVDLGGYEERRVQQLSGGQQQRIALARALAPEPSVLLLDEPLSNLDAALRERTRSELRALLKRLGVTVVFVTHDQEEAYALSDRIALLDGGRLQQLGTPEELYDEPANPFVASFLGRANFIDARVIARGDDGALVCELPGGATWRASAGTGDADDVGAADAPRPVRLMVRPHTLRLLPAETPREPADLPGTVVERRFAGAVAHYRVRCGELELLVIGSPDAAEAGDDLVVRQAPGAAARAFTAGAEPAAPVPTAVPARAE